MQKLIRHCSNILGIAEQLQKNIYNLHRQAGSHSAGVSQSQLKIIWKLVLKVGLQLFFVEQKTNVVFLSEEQKQF